MQARGRGTVKPAIGIAFDADLGNRIDAVLAVAMLNGMVAKGEARRIALSISRPSLKSAQLADVFSAFYAGRVISPLGGVGSNPEGMVGMCAGGLPQDDRPAFDPLLSKKAADGTPLYSSNISRILDTAESSVLIRNVLLAQNDENGGIVLAGPATGLARLLGLYGSRPQISTKVKQAVVAIGAYPAGPVDPSVKADVPAARTLFAEWPTPLIAVGTEVGSALAYPGSSIDQDFSWATAHPVADAYRLFKPMPYDAPAMALAALLYAVHPDDGYFKLSPPGTITVLDDGRTQFAPSASGKHRYLVADPGQTDRIMTVYKEMVLGQAGAATWARPRRSGRQRGVARVKSILNNKPGLNVFTCLAGLAATVWLAGVGVRVSGQTAPAPVKQAAAVPARPATPAARPAAAPAVRTPGPTQAAFDSVTKSLFNDTCAECHNNIQLEAGLDLTKPYTVESLASERDLWDVILTKLKAGEMPPPDVVRPDAQIKSLVSFLETEFERADSLVKPDPGRVTARRLNRAEYTNTVRDLLAVDFRADRNFPTDDSGDGFDNIGEILTVSPVLMEKYISAAGRIAHRAIGAEPLPKPVEIEYSLRFKNLRRLDPSHVEATHRIDFDAEYTLRIGLPGQRAKDAPPVKMGLWVDGKLAQTKQVETKPSGLVYFNPYSEEEMRVPLTEGDHTLRLGFIDDDFVKTLAKEDIYKDTVNKWVGSVTIVGPFPSTEEKPSRKKILVCDPKTSAVCVNRILTTLARRAYRRPVTQSEVIALTRFVSMAKADGQSAEQGIALAIQAMLVSPNFLFHIERDVNPTDALAVHRVSDVELASRLSYFLWNSMPDEELLGLAERRQLSAPPVLDAQVKRMLADPKAFALAENFAGQWLEIRNLDTIKPDPQKFPEWGPELRDAMKTETRMFFDAMLRENRPIGEFLNARYTYLNEFLANYYGIDGVKGPEFRRVDLTTDQRGGVLGQGSVLAVSSYPTRTSVVIRGKYILQNILGTPPPPPPPNVPPLDEDAVGTAASLRKQMEKHRSNPVCASCHSRMDPLGFALENYDAIGKWRTKDGNFPVDSSGVLPSGRSFSTPAEMRQVLSDMLPDFARCLTQKMLTYTLGRGLERYDRVTVQGIDKRLAASGYGFQTLVNEVVRSLPFQSRRGEAVQAVNTAK